MENTQDNMNNQEQSGDNTRNLIHQLTPILAAISMVSLPSSENESEESEPEHEDSEMDQTTGTETDPTKEATKQDKCPGASCIRARILFLEQRNQYLERENNKLVKLIKIEQKKLRRAEAKNARAENLDFDGDKEYFEQLEKQKEEAEKESETWGKRTQYYRFKCLADPTDFLAYTNDITNTYASVEALFRSHLYMAITTTGWSDPQTHKEFELVIWIDWELEAFKTHEKTMKTSMERIVDGERKERKLFYSTNEGVGFFLSYAFQAIQFHNDRYLRRYGLELKETEFSFTEGKRVRNLVLKGMKDERRRDWIMAKTRERVMVLRSNSSNAKGGM